MLPFVCYLFSYQSFHNKYLVKVGIRQKSQDQLCTGQGKTPKVDLPLKHIRSPPSPPKRLMLLLTWEVCYLPQINLSRLNPVSTNYRLNYIYRFVKAELKAFNNNHDGGRLC